MSINVIGRDIMNWNSAIFWGIIGILSTIFFGYLFAYIFYKKSIKKKKIYIDVNSNILISEDLSNYEGLKVLYNNEEINTLTSSTIIIANIGNDLIEMDDIISSDPITISTSNKFLTNNIEEYVVTSSNKKVSASLQKINDSILQLVFDFLRPKDNIKVTLLHDGMIDIGGELKIGTIEKCIDYDQNSRLTKRSLFEEIFEAEIHMFQKMSPQFVIIYCFTVFIILLFIFLFSSLLK